MIYRNIAIIGANGHLGPTILKHLVAQPHFNVTVISRRSSKSTYPSNIKVIRVADDLPSDELINALKGHDALVVTTGGSLSALQMKLADACVAAGVRTFIPADFGSCDSSSPRALELVPLYKAKTKVREYLQTLEDKLSWTSLVCGHFFDYGLTTGLLHFDIKNRKARIFDGGEIRASAATLDRVASATVRVLECEVRTRNKMLYVQSFCVTQNQVLAAVEKVTGAKFEVEDAKSEVYIEKLKKELEENPSDGEATENMVGVVGIIDANWESRANFAMETLGLEEEDLEDVVRKALNA